MKPLLTIVIPTWNRRDLCAVAIDSLCQQIGELPVELIVSDHGSSDGTFAMLKEKQRIYPMLSPYVCRRTETPDFSDNFKFAFDLPESQWTWTFGDDDYAFPGAVKTVLDLLDDRTVFFHIAEKLRSKNTHQLIGGTLLELCNNIGFLEMTGFITCNIIRTEVLKEAVNSENWDEYAKSAFPQSLSLLEVAQDKQAAFADYALVECQNRDSEETAKRWAQFQIGARYTGIIDSLKLALPSNTPVQPKFFRYQSYYLWDRLIADQSNAYYEAIFRNPHANVVEGFEWDKFTRIAEYLAEPHATKLRDDFEKSRSLCDNHFAALVALNNAASTLDQHILSHYTEYFPFNYIGAIGDKGESASSSETLAA